MFRRSDVISAGDPGRSHVLSRDQREKGGSVQAVIDGLNRLKLMAVPAKYKESGMVIVPGHGRLADPPTCRGINRWSPSCAIGC